MPANACYDCANCVRGRPTLLDWAPISKCADEAVRDPVSGAATVECSTMRAEYGLCGPQGRLWKPANRVVAGTAENAPQDATGPITAARIAGMIWPGGRRVGT